MEKSRPRLEDIIESNIGGKVLALGLSYTRLGPSCDQRPPYRARWEHPEVMQTTVSLLRLLDENGLAIGPKSSIETADHIPVETDQI